MRVLTDARATPRIADRVGQPLRTQSYLFEIRRYFYAAAGIQQQGHRRTLNTIYQIVRFTRTHERDNCELTGSSC